MCRHTNCWFMEKLHNSVSDALLRHSATVLFPTLNRHSIFLQCSRVWGTVLHRHVHCASDCYSFSQNSHVIGSYETTKIIAPKLVTCNTLQRNRVVPGWAPSPPPLWLVITHSIYKHTHMRLLLLLLGGGDDDPDTLLTNAG